MDIYLKEVFLHIIDRQTGSPVLSEVQLDLSQDYIREYIEKKIQKMYSPQSKAGRIDPSSAIGEMILQPCDLKELSQKLVNHWYQIYQQSDDGPSCDCIVAKYELDTTMYIAFLKMNYSQGYTHYLDQTESGIYNQLILHQAILPSKTQKVDEGAIINLETLEFQLLEKRYTFSGEKRYYFSTEFIAQEPSLSLEENVKTIKKVASKIGSEFADEDYQVVAKVKQALVDSIEQNGYIEPKEIAESVFKENITAQLAFQEKVAEKGVSASAPLIANVKEVSEKKYGKQKLKLSNGIEMIIPMDVYQDPNLLEFVNQPDGTISVMIKNVEDISTKL